MKNFYFPLTLVIFLIFLCFSSYAQDDGCITPDISEEEYIDLPWYNNPGYLDNLYDSLRQVYESTPIARYGDDDIEEPWLRIPIQFWLYLDDTGGPGNGTNDVPHELDIKRAMNHLNSTFRDNGIKIQFYYCLQPVNNTSAIIMNNIFEKTALATHGTGNRRAGAINIHIVQDGGNEFNPVYDAIFLNRIRLITEGSESTLTHEVGHYFSLLHTHFGYNVPCLREPVSRGWIPRPFCFNNNVPKTCAVTGDLLVDTPADPNMSGQYNQGDCEYTGTGTDFYGTAYSPDERNVMAYGNRPCRSNFSNGQRNVMYFSAFLGRKDEIALGGWNPTPNNAFDRYEPDNVDIAATELSLNTTQEHSFHSNNCPDVNDWLRIDIPEGGGDRYFLSVENVPGYANPVSQVEVYSLVQTMADPFFEASSNPIATLSTSTGTLNLPCTIFQPNNSYFIRLTNGGSGVGRYKVSFFDQGDQSISGPSQVCGSNGTFSIQNLPSNAVVSWDKSPNLNYISGQGSTSYTVGPVPGVSGPGWVEATVSGDCGELTPIRFDIWVGKTYPSFAVLNSNCIQPRHRWTLPEELEGSNFSWSINNSNLRLSSTNSRTVEVYNTGGVPYGSSQSYTITVTVNNNSCTRTSSTTDFFQPDECYCGIQTAGCNPDPCNDCYEPVVYPNPSPSGVFTIEIDEHTEAPAGEEFHILILDNNNNVIYDKHTRQRKINLNLQHVEKGIYFLLLHQKEGTVKKRILIE